VKAAIHIRRAPVVLLLSSLLLLPFLGGGQGQSAGQRASKDATSKLSAPVEAEVRFTDDSVLKLKLRDKSIGLTTRYGKLSVPVAAVRYIDFATRISPAVTQRAEAAVAKLGDLQYAVRQAAGAELLELRAKAYPALLPALRHKDPEIARRAEALVKQLREQVPMDQLVVRKDDVIITVDSRLAGRIDAEALQAFTVQFGEVPLKLVHLRSLQYTSVDPDPGHVDGLRSLIGKTFRFKVTGAMDGPLFGSGVYTSDSSLATAAVHIGVLRPGQTGVVRVTFVASPHGFGGSVLNGVASMPFGGPFRGAFMVSR
jgi:hypothetical protein